MEKKEVPAQPGRLINAIARIGYDPEVALCDLIDNSVDAGATDIKVVLKPEVHGETGETDSIASYEIADNGTGMDPDRLVSAFSLGASRKYPGGSLGKFGLGLKSASLSLGNRIILVSKTAAAANPTCAILSMSDINESGRYEVDFGDPPERYRQRWQDLCPNFDQGTLLIIEELNENQPSYSRFLDYLQRYCSIVYHMFLEGEDAIAVEVGGIKLKPKDPLFLQEARANGSLNPLDWDGKTSKLLLGDTALSLVPGVDAEIAATNLIHPPSFGEEAIAKRDEYAIETDPYTRRARHGFYVYRNKRIIVMAERFHGLVSNAVQTWAFRGRLMFDESADNILSLDVKKRHCQLPKAARSNLQSMMRNHITTSTEAWKTAGARQQQKRRETKEDIANQSIGHTPVADLNYAPGAELTGQADIDLRNNLMTEVGQRTLEQILDPQIDRQKLEQAAQAKSTVVPAQGLRGNAMWLPFPATDQGAAQTVVNHQHSWIAEAYGAAEDNPVVTLILHQFLTILARAELEMRSTAWRDTRTDVVDKVLERFRRKASAIAEDLAESLAAQIAKYSESDGRVDE